MPPKKGHPKPEYSHEQRADIVERVCALYETMNATIESCCEACGISQATFYVWTANFGEIRERYKKAKAAASNNFFENVLVPKAMTATELLLMEREVEEFKSEEVIHQGVKSKDDEGKPITKGTVIRSKQQPNATTAIFIMKAAFPERFREKVDLSGSLTIGGQIDHTPEQAAKILAAIRGEL